MATAQAPVLSKIRFAHEAFTTGYAIHGNLPLLGRARTALEAAEALLTETDSPGALVLVEAKATKEGVYNKIYQRRDRLWMKYDRRARKWAARLALDVPADAVTADILSHTGLSITEADKRTKLDADYRHAISLDLSCHTCKYRVDNGEQPSTCRLVEGTVDPKHVCDLYDPSPMVEESGGKEYKDRKAIIGTALTDTMIRYRDLKAELRQMVAAAMAEAEALGKAAAAAMLAVRDGTQVPNMDTLAASNLKTLQQSRTYWDGVDDISQDMIDGLAGDASMSMQTRVDAGADQGQLNDYITGAIAAGAGAAGFLDQHIHTVFALALLVAFAAAGSSDINFVTVGDNRVCAQCVAAEDDSPYKPSEAPPIPQHFGCRCWYEPA